jgi:hypothetical protein
MSRIVIVALVILIGDELQTIVTLVILNGDGLQTLGDMQQYET